MIRYTAHANGVDWARLIVDLEADRFHNGRSPEELERSFRNSAVLALAWEGDRVVGTARASHSANALHAALGYRRDGIGFARVVGAWLGRDAAATIPRTTE
jgi:hypothetical protein